jgi:hypothetical protein
MRRAIISQEIRSSLIVFVVATVVAERRLMARKRARLSPPDPVSQEAALLADRPDLEPPPVDFGAARMLPVPDPQDPEQERRPTIHEYPLSVQQAAQQDLSAILAYVEVVQQALTALEGVSDRVAVADVGLAREIRRVLSYLQAVCLPAVRTRTTALVQGLARDAVPEAQQYAARRAGAAGHRHAAHGLHDEIRRAAAQLQHANPEGPIKAIDIALSEKYGLSTRQIRRIRTTH